MNKHLLAQITNPALQQFNTPEQGGAGLAFYIAQLWKTVVIVGTLGFLLYLVWGGLRWMIAGGDKNDVESAKSQISSALIGLAFLVGSYAIVSLVAAVFKIDILNIDWTFGGR